MYDWQRTLLLLGLLLPASTTSAAQLTLQSGPHQTIMIELYTSEGCSSCPPADRFLNRLATRKQLWKTFVPLAFHVDYWDNLGWRDRFASAANSRRQRRYARYHAATTVYTPEFFVNGREWHRGGFSSLTATARPLVGVLRLRLHGQQLDAQFTPVGAGKRRVLLHVARLGMQLVSQVRRGENAGRVLHHDFVVLQHIILRGGQLRWSTTLSAPVHPAPQQALVAWISRFDDPRPLQAVGGYLPPDHSPD